MILAGLDIGTTSICCVLLDADKGSIRHTFTADNDAAIPSPHPWEKLQNPMRILEITEMLLQRAREAEPEISAIGISCQMHGILYTDNGGNSVSPLYTWQDGRVQQPQKNGMTHAAVLAERSGYSVPPGYGLATHYYNEVQDEVPPGAGYLCTIGDFVAMRLCGAAVPVTDASNAAGLGMFRLDRLDFDRSAVEKAGMDPRMLPQIHLTGGPIGKTEWGTPVACAIGDNQASFIGAVPSLDQSVLFNIGTGSQLSVYSTIWEAEPLLEARPFPGGGYLLVGASLSGGKVYALLEQFFREACGHFGGYQGGSLFEQMNELAMGAMEEGLQPPHVDTRFFGTRQNPDALGAIEQIDASNLTPRHLVLGFLNGMLGELLHDMNALPPDVFRMLKFAVGSGNGIRRNPAMRRLLEEKVHFPVYFSPVMEEAAYGAAVYAGVAIGAYSDFHSAIRNLSKLREVQDEA